MRIFKRIAVPILFLAILMGVNAIFNYLLIAYTFTRYKLHKIETEAFDDLILGSSHGATNIDPAYVSSVTGRSAFNAAQGEEFPVDSYFFLKDALPTIEGMASGSTFKEISGSAMRTVPAVIPDDATLQRFSAFCNPLFEQQRILEQQNRELASLRDALLPKLMSGEIDVSSITL